MRRMARLFAKIKRPKLQRILAGVGCLCDQIRAWLCDPANLALCGIVLLAATLRLAQLDLIEFKADEAAHLLRAAEIAEQHRLPLIGSLASVGIAKPPMMSLLMAVPLLLGRDPRLAAAFIALLNVAAVAGCYLLARRYYGLRVAAIAATLFAVNPWAIVYSRKVFTADVLAPFLVLCLYALHAAIADRAAWGWFLAVISLGVMLNVTFSPLPLVLVLLALVAVYRRRVGWRSLFAGAILAGLLFVPYLYGQLRHLPGLWVLLRAASQGGPGFGIGARALQLAASLHSGTGIGALAGASFPAFGPAHSPLRHLDQALALLFLLSLPGIVTLGLRARAQPQERPPAPAYAILGCWLLVSLAVVSLQSVSLEPHYLVILYPAGFIAMAVTVDGVLRALSNRGAGAPLQWRRAARLGLWGGLLAVVAWQAYTIVYLYRFVARHDTGGGYGVPLRYWQGVAGLARRGAAIAGASEVWIITQGADVAYEQSPLILHYLLGPDLRAVFLGQGGNEALLLPAGQPGVYLLTRPVPAPLEAMLERLGGQERGSLPGPSGPGVTRVIVAPAHSPAELLEWIPHRAQGALDAGLSLLGYEWPAVARPGDTVALATYWAFEGVADAERGVQHSLFNHLLNASAEKVAQRDGFGLPERYWRDGLLLVQWFDLPLPADLPPGDYTLLTGMYRLSDFSRHRVRDRQGVDVGDAIALGPVQVTR